MTDSDQPLDPRERFARSVVQKLTDAGHIAYFAGGCVRDRILGLRPKDFDVATDATPDRIRELFGRRRTLAIGAAFGVVSVLGRKGAGEDPIEVATFRSDGDYSDGRRPDSVVFSSPEHDAQRRDFTINGLFYDPIAGRVIDFVDGRSDLQAGVLRAIGDPDARICEDKLRMLRAVRMATVFGFEIESATRDALHRHAAEIDVVSNERVGAEMRRLLAATAAFDGLATLRETRISDVVFPQLAEIWEAAIPQADLPAQFSFPAATGAVLLSKLLGARRECDFVSGLIVCLLAIQWSGGDSGNALRRIADLWRLSNEETARAAFALESLSTVLQADRQPWSIVQPVLAARYAGDAVTLAETVTRAMDLPGEAVAVARQRLGWDRARLDPPALLSGNTLQKLGLTPGPGFREILQDVRARQLDGELNDAEVATGYVRQTYF
ncbi:tRNA nucleotidyltransferase/poly(A) polymerase [Rosistilla carotiformis]|uniref:tRNA nucleotidyltransferase/poly(A) polymerase n=1 Tax=Rosistilla carotiformis TaxID=2528017 RepID=A0A518JQ04_9BACT|nr:CCA tRNA nucleotidyltransferase [Rosistilla carotiformis]QDV67616.1 tRNA nucleotidyltransferase/poly(A) polymerase [Rosistilla carotiformis]